VNGVSWKPPNTASRSSFRKDGASELSESHIPDGFSLLSSLKFLYAILSCLFVNKKSFQQLARE
tara:strand:- start:6686 stop:6877 length:192 start_codon:yes stop_codon:yes gene_type:complete